MRFKAQIQNIATFTKFVASLASLGPVAWVRLSENEVRFTIIPEQGTQVWAVLTNETVFDSYVVQSASSNVINLEVPLNPLLRALKSALQATSASIRLTKKDGLPLLSLTIVTSSSNSSLAPFTAFGASTNVSNGGRRVQEDEDREMSIDFERPSRERETIITQDVPIRVLSPQLVEGIHEPQCRDPDVHILLPPLGQLKAISDRFTRLAVTSREKSGGSGFNTLGPRLEMSANMHGCLKIAIKTDAMTVKTVWTGLNNPELDPSQVEGGEAGIINHPSTRIKELGGPDGKSDEGWATVRIDGRDWGKVMSVGRLGGRVIACFCHEHALILYVYLSSGDDGGEESVLTLLQCMRYNSTHELTMLCFRIPQPWEELVPSGKSLALHDLGPKGWVAHGEGASCTSAQRACGIAWQYSTNVVEAGSMAKQHVHVVEFAGGEFALQRLSPEEL